MLVPGSAWAQEPTQPTNPVFSLSSLLGIDKSVDKTQAAVADLLDSKVQPLMQEVENRLGGIGESLLDRVDGATITIPEIKIELKLKPIPRAVPNT
jgi:hypothetical protein